MFFLKLRLFLLELFPFLLLQVDRAARHVVGLAVALEHVAKGLVVEEHHLFVAADFVVGEFLCARHRSEKGLRSAGRLVRHAGLVFGEVELFFRGVKEEERTVDVPGVESEQAAFHDGEFARGRNELFVGLFLRERLAFLVLAVFEHLRLQFVELARKEHVAGRLIGFGVGLDGFVFGKAEGVAAGRRATGESGRDGDGQQYFLNVLHFLVLLWLVKRMSEKVDQKTSRLDSTLPRRLLFWNSRAGSCAAGSSACGSSCGPSRISRARSMPEKR